LRRQLGPSQLSGDGRTAERRVTPSGLLDLAIVYLIWGSTYLGIRVAVREGAGFPPFALGFTRLVVAGALLFAWSAFRGLRLRLTRTEMITLAISGLLLWPGANGLVSWAEQRADSGYAALLVATVPIWTAAIDALVSRRRPSMRLGVSLLVGFAGVTVLAAPRLLASGGIDAFSVVLLLIAPICWAVGSVLQMRRPVSVSPWVGAAYLHAFGAMGFAVLTLLMREPLPRPTAAAWGAWAYLVIAGSLIAFPAFVRILAKLPTNIAMTYAYVNPVVAVILGWMILSEPVTPVMLVGMALVLAGVWGVFGERAGVRRTPDRS